MFLTIIFKLSPDFSGRDELVGLAFPRYLETSRVITDLYGAESASFYSDTSSSITLFFFATSLIIVLCNLIVPKRLVAISGLVGTSRRDIGVLFFLFGLGLHLLIRTTVVARIYSSGHFQGSFTSYILFFKEYVFSFFVFAPSGTGILLMVSFWLRSDLK